jgi:UDP-N-acetylglucosamine acyltransferase
MQNIARFAVVESTAEVAENVQVGAFSYIGAEVSIGPDCVIDSNVTITGKTTIGPKCHIYPLAIIGAAEGRANRPAKVTIGEANTIREHVVVYGGQDDPTRVGSDNLIMIGSRIGAAAQIGNHGIFDNCSQIGAAACVEDYVRTSGFATICEGRTVGAYSFVTGFTCVNRDVPPYSMIQGRPFRVRGVNWRNLKRCGFGEDDIHALKRAFRELFNGADVAGDPEALQHLLAADGANPHVARLIEAVKRSAARAGDSSDD